MARKPATGRQLIKRSEVDEDVGRDDRVPRVRVLAERACDLADA
jgi:hypothetical protein